MEFMNPISFWPFAIYLIAVLLLTGGMLLVSYYIGERHTENATNEIFESGVRPTGPARFHFPIHFYLIAMFFVIFDLEAVFIFIWAVSVRETGWSGYLFMLIFVAELLILLFYLWKIGALDFGPDRKAIMKAYLERIKKKSNEMVDE